MNRSIWILALLLSLLPGSIHAQSQEVEKLTLKAIQADKKRIVAINMQLNELEQPVFWPLYEAYQKDLIKLEDQMVKILKDYAAHYQSLTNEKAKDLLDQYFAVEEQLLQLKKTHSKKFAEALPMKRVARYLQIENKIEAMTNYGLVDIIPLVK